MILRHGADGQYEIYDIGNNSLLAAYQLGQVGTDWEFVGLGGFFGSDTTDMLLRNSTTGGFEVYDISNNLITNAAFLGTIGQDWQLMGFGNFSQPRRNRHDLAQREHRRNSRSTISATTKSPASPFMGTVGLNWQFSGVGNFSSRGTSDMILRNANTGGLEVYDINNNQITGAAFIGTVGLDWQFSGVGNFSGNPGETDLLVAQQQDRRVGSLRHQQQSTHRRRLHRHGGLGLAVRGHRPDSRSRRVRSGVAQRQHRRNSRSTISRQQSLVGAASLGTVGLDWQLGGFAADPPTGSAHSRISRTINSCRRWRVSAAAAAQPTSFEYRPSRCRHVTADVADDTAARLMPPPPKWICPANFV